MCFKSDVFVGVLYNLILVVGVFNVYYGLFLFKYMFLSVLGDDVLLIDVYY